MKKFLAMALVSTMAFSAAACNKNGETDKPESDVVIEDTNEEIEENLEDETVDEGENADDGSDGTLLGLTYEVPESWSSGVVTDDYIWIAPEGMGNSMFLQVFEGDAGDDFNVMGVGRFSTQAEGTEPVEIAPFDVGNFTWHGYSIIFPGYYGQEQYVLLASNVDKTGKSVGTWIDMGNPEEPDFTLESEEILGILESVEFLY